MIIANQKHNSAPGSDKLKNTKINSYQYLSHTYPHHQLNILNERHTLAMENQQCNRKNPK